jgi:peptide/nickel transport system ATP-binding protein
LTPAAPILDVHSLEVAFDAPLGLVKAVNGVSFSLQAGETVALVGESGSGKTVTALSLLRLLHMPPGRIAGGEVLFQSPTLGPVDLLRLPERQLERVRGNDISMIFQEPGSALNPVFACGDQVAEGLLLHRKLSRREARERTLALFEQVRLPHPEQVYRAYPHELSGGQQQRVLIAMAMACEPAILIADEPTTALDVTVQARVLALLDDLRVRNNMALLFISHDLGVVADIADRVLVLYKGKVVEQGPVLDIFTNPQHPYTKGLLACRPSLAALSGQKRLSTVADFMAEDAAGTLVEKDTLLPQVETSLQDVVNEYVSTMARVQLKQKLQAIREPLVQVQDLQVHFPIRKGFFSRPREFVKAVDGVSFEIYPGETVGLVGESGSGKTTIGRALLRLVEPTAGQVRFEGQDLAQLPPEELRRRRKDFQMIFQDPFTSLNPMMTVGEAILEPMRVHRVLPTEAERRGKAMALLQTVNLQPEHFYRYPHEFSGGQRQRICIARALALEPKFLVCDESVSALDVSVQAQVLNLLNQLKEDLGITTLFITHDLSVARFISDRILVMHQGRIIESGTARSVYENPQHPYTQTLLAAVPKGTPEAIRAAQLRREALRSGVKEGYSFLL